MRNDWSAIAYVYWQKQLPTEGKSMGMTTCQDKFFYTNIVTGRLAL